jgi:transcriptional regulator with XRE-family HTH domain
MGKNLVYAVASTIRHFRTSSGMSQEELADKAGLDRTYISGVERGVRNITLESLEQIIRALAVSTKGFFTKVSQEIDESD